MHIAVHGLGYVGLTCAVHLAKAGVRVLGYDPDQAVVDALNNGEPKAGEFLGYLGDAGLRELPLRATTNWDEVSAQETHILAVPTEKHDRPWMELVSTCVRQLMTTSNAKLIIIESTLTPGAIDVMRSLPWWRDDVLVAHAPRRDWFADAQKNLGSIDRVLGGVTEAATGAALAILLHVTPAKHIRITDHRTAELVKPLENALFHLPIMLAHELANLYPNRDIAKALELAATHWRFASFGGLYTGIGSGGRCVPMGGRYLIAGQHGGQGGQMLNAAQETEGYVTEGAARAIADAAPGPKLILGMAYRPNFADLGGSPGMRLARELAFVDDQRVWIHDAVASPAAVRAQCDLGVNSEMIEIASTFDDGVPALSDYHVIVLATAHAAYVNVPEMRLQTIQRGAVVFDVHGSWAKHKDLFQSMDVAYRQVGKPGWRFESTVFALE